MSDSNVGDTTKNIETEDKVIDWEARAKHAEARIQSIRNTSTQDEDEEDNVVENKSNSFDENTYMKLREEEKFFDANPDMLEYKEKVLARVAKWNSFKEAKALVELDDETIANRKTAQNTNFTSGDTPNELVSIKKSDLWDMSQEKYNKAMDAIESGKAKLT